MKAVILGYGKMGSFFAKTLSNFADVYVYDPKKTIFFCEQIKSLKDISEIKPDFILNAAPLQKTKEAFDNALKHYKTDLIDIMSIKGDIFNYYDKNKIRFLSIHPMFGPNFANLDALKEEKVIFIKESNSRHKKFFKNFFNYLNLEVIELSKKEHDKEMSLALAIPFSLSFIFKRLDKSYVFGTTYKRHKEIANRLLLEDKELLAEIMTNSYNSEILKEIEKELALLKSSIKSKEKMKKYISDLK